MKELFTSKKFIVTIAGIIGTIAAKKGLNLDPELTYAIVGLIMAYVLGQGASDFGKAAAQIKADAPASPEMVNIQNVEAEKPTTRR